MLLLVVDTGDADYANEVFGQKILDLARHLFRMFALALHLPESHFDAMTTHPGGYGRLMYYPAPSTPANASPISNTSSSSEEIGLGAHTDYECFCTQPQDINPVP